MTHTCGGGEVGGIEGWFKVKQEFHNCLVQQGVQRLISEACINRQDFPVNI